MALTVTYKKDHHPIRWFFVILLIAAVGYVGWGTYRWYTTGESFPLPFIDVGALQNIDASDVSGDARRTHQVPPSEPRFLSVPEIDVVSSRVFSGGLSDQNLIETPKNIHDTIWFNKSASPGDGGVIILSVVTRADGVSKAFAGLNTISVGSHLMLTRGDGEKFIYNVSDTEAVPIEDMSGIGMKKMVASPEPGTESLTIIANAGKYIPKLGTYDKRVIVRAILVE